MGVAKEFSIEKTKKDHFFCKKMIFFDEMALFLKIVFENTIDNCRNLFLNHFFNR